MAIFHPRVIKKRISSYLAVPENHRAILDAWAKSLAGGIYDVETKNDAEFIQRILVDILGYQGSSAGSEWTVAKNQAVGSGNVDVALGHFASDGTANILAPFELKGARTKDLDALMPGRNKSPVQQAWEYAMDAHGARWVLVSNYREIRLYAVGYGRKNYETFDLSTASDRANYQRLQLLLGARNLLSGNTQKLLQESESAEREITGQLYAEYHDLRIKLVNVISEAKRWPLNDAIRVTQTILDRVLFIAFAEDRGLLQKDTLRDAYSTKSPFNPQPAWDNFKGLFAAIDKGSEKLNIPGYNGGLFAADHQIESLRLSDTICAELAALGNYDYESDVSVNILGHVFEQSISDLEELKNGGQIADDGVGKKRRSDGIFYTPPFVTRLIVEMTVGQWLRDRKEELGIDKAVPLTEKDYATIKVVERGANKGRVVYNQNVARHIKLWELYKDKVSNIRVLDPACGSGAFLNEVFDFLFQEGQVINSTLETLYGGQISFFRWDTHILSRNIFGVDINEKFVEITKLSLWLKTANRNEKLSYLDDNVRPGNSLVKDKDIAGDLAFDWKKAFPTIMAAGGFDVVLGNPPYVDSEAMTKVWPRERDYITKNFKHTKGNWDLYIAFLELGCDLITPKGFLSFITPDKWISKDFGVEMRKRVLPGLVSILPVGRDVFESALVDSIITTVSGSARKSLQVLALEDGRGTVRETVPKKEIDPIQGFDQLLSSNATLLKRLEAAGNATLIDLAPAENACATSDTYVLKDFISEARDPDAISSDHFYKVANTGTLDPYVFRWGFKPMRYLGSDYLHPVVKKKEFTKHLGKTYVRRAASPKIVIKGLTLLEGALDLPGEFIPGKSTIVICHESGNLLKQIAAIVNSKLASFYIKQRYASASYNGGVNFTPDMIDTIPVPKLSAKMFLHEVDEIIECSSQTLALAASLHDLIIASSKVKISKKLFFWYTLSEQEFFRELVKQGVKTDLKERAEWLQLFVKGKRRIAQFVHRREVAQNAIDKLMFELFSLKPEERLIIENNF